MEREDPAMEKVAESRQERVMIIRTKPQDMITERRNVFTEGRNVFALTM
jgi:hypothetical protein